MKAIVFCFMIFMLSTYMQGCKKIEYDTKYRITYSVENEYILPNEPALRFDVVYKTPENPFTESNNNNRFQYNFETTEGETCILSAKAKQSQNLKASIIVNGIVLASQTDSIIRLELKLK